MEKLELLTTLWPSFPHFSRFSSDSRLSGIRLNSAMTDSTELLKEFELLDGMDVKIPLFFDVKGRQLRVDEVHFNPNYLDISLNHPISVDTPTGVLFKAEMDFAVLDHLEEDGRRLIFRGGPKYIVKAGESLHIRHPSLRVFPPMFTDKEKDKIQKVKSFGIKRYFLSFVQDQAYVDEFLELVGSDSEAWLKIEDEHGLNYVATEFKKRPNLILVAARGDLYVELGKPHLMANALKLIINKDSEACVASRILLSVIPPLGWREQEMVRNIWHMLNDDPTGKEPIDPEKLRKIVTTDPKKVWKPQVPNCADFMELAWLYGIGYRRMMLCDELCLKEELLATAVNAFDSFRRDYTDKT